MGARSISFVQTQWWHEVEIRRSMVLELLGGFCVSSKHKVSKEEKGERNEAQWSATIVVGEQAKKKKRLPSIFIVSSQRSEFHNLLHCVVSVMDTCWELNNWLQDTYWKCLRWNGNGSTVEQKRIKMYYVGRRPPSLGSGQLRMQVVPKLTSCLGWIKRRLSDTNFKFSRVQINSWAPYYIHRLKKHGLCSAWLPATNGDTPSLICRAPPCTILLRDE